MCVYAFTHRHKDTQKVNPLSPVELHHPLDRGSTDGTDAVRPPQRVRTFHAAADMPRLSMQEQGRPHVGEADDAVHLRLSPLLVLAFQTLGEHIEEVSVRVHDVLSDLIPDLGQGSCGV